MPALGNNVELVSTFRSGVLCWVCLLVPIEAGVTELQGWGKTPNPAKSGRLTWSLRYQTAFFYLSSDNTTKIIYCSTRRLLNTDRKVRHSIGGFWSFSASPCCCHLSEPSFVSFLGLQPFPGEGTTPTQVQGHVPKAGLCLFP